MLLKSTTKEITRSVFAATFIGAVIAILMEELFYGSVSYYLPISFLVVLVGLSLFVYAVSLAQR